MCCANYAAREAPARSVHRRSTSSWNDPPQRQLRRRYVFGLAIENDRLDRRPIKKNKNGRQRIATISASGLPTIARWRSSGSRKYTSARTLNPTTEPMMTRENATSLGSMNVPTHLPNDTTFSAGRSPDRCNVVLDGRSSTSGVGAEFYETGKMRT